MSSHRASNQLTIRELPRSDRPRERLVDLGVQALSTAELLALLMGSGGREQSALQLGRSVFAASGGSLRRIARDPVAALTAIPGVGMARAVAIHAALELGRRLAGEDRIPGAPIQSPRDVVQWYAPRMEDLAVEEFHVAVLDAQHRLERAKAAPPRGSTARPMRPVTAARSRRECRPRRGRWQSRHALERMHRRRREASIPPR